MLRIDKFPRFCWIIETICWHKAFLLEGCLAIDLEGIFTQKILWSICFFLHTSSKISAEHLFFAQGCVRTQKIACIQVNLQPSCFSCKIRHHRLRLHTEWKHILATVLKPWKNVSKYTIKHLTIYNEKDFNKTAYGLFIKKTLKNCSLNLNKFSIVRKNKYVDFDSKVYCIVWKNKNC
jgi:hypothetical protein